jgi:GcrA cell cycle regulator
VSCRPVRIFRAMAPLSQIRCRKPSIKIGDLTSWFCHYLRDGRATPRDPRWRETVMRGIWTCERIELLKKLWTEGETATAIAARLRMSRAAVLGKVFRLRLRPAQKATAASTRRGPAMLRRRHKSRPPIKHRTKPAAPAAPAPPAAPAAIPAGKTLFELTNGSCRWPHGQPGTKAFHFCGAPGADLEAGRPYCERHARRAYVGHGKTPAAPAEAADAPITAPSIVPSGAKRFAFSQGRKRF